MIDLEAEYQAKKKAAPAATGSLEEAYQRNQANKKIEDPGVMAPQGSQNFDSGMVARGLLELGGMAAGAGAGGYLAKKGVQYAAPKIASRLGVPQRFLGITEPGAGIVGELGGAGLGGGTGAVLGDAAYPPPNLSPGDLNLRSSFVRGAESGVAGQGIGMGIVKGLDLGLKGISSKLTGTATPPDIAVMNQANRMGVTLRPAEVSQSDVASSIEQNVRRSLFGKNEFQKRDIANEQAFRGTIETYADRVHGAAKTPMETGRLIGDAIKGQAIPEYQAVTKGLYENLHRNAGEAAVVNGTPLFAQTKALVNSLNDVAYPKAKALAKEIEAAVSDTGYTTGLNVKATHDMLPSPTTGMKVQSRSSQAKPEQTITSPILNASGQPIVTGTIPAQPSKLQGLRITERSEAQPVEGGLEGLKVTARSEGPARPRNLTFMDAHAIRSRLLELNRTGESLPDRASAIAGNLAKTLDTAMEQAATKGGYVADWRIANASTKEGHKVFDSQIIRNLTKKNPEDVVAAAFQKNAETETDTIMSALRNQPDAIKVYQRAALDQLMRKATSDGFLDGRSLWNAAYGKNGIGETVMKKTFAEGDPAYYAQLRQFLEVGKRMNQSAMAAKEGMSPTAGRMVTWLEQGMIIQVPSNLAKNLIKGDIAKAGMDLISDLTRGGTYILTTKQLSKLLNSPEGLRVLTKGMNMRTDYPNAALAIDLLSKITAIAGGHLIQQTPASKNKEPAPAPAPAPIPAPAPEPEPQKAEKKGKKIRKTVNRNSRGLIESIDTEELD